MEESSFKPGAVEDMAQRMAQELDPKGENRQAVEERVLDFIIAEQAAGQLDEERLLERVVEALAPKSPAQQRVLLQSVMQKVEHHQTPGVGQEFGLRND